MADTSFWVYELPQVSTRLIGMSPDEIKAVFPYLEGRHNLDFDELKAGPFYEIDKFVINYLAPPDQSTSLICTVPINSGVRVRFNPASFLELIKESKEAYERRVGDLYIFRSRIFDSDLELFLPGYAAHSLKAHPWGMHVGTMERMLRDRTSKKSLEAQLQLAMDESGSHFKQ